MISKSWTDPRRERGEGKVGAIIALVVVALAIHVAWEFIPYKVLTAEFEKAIEDDLLSLAANLRQPDEFVLAVVSKADELQLGLKEDDLKLELVGETWKFNTTYQVTLKMIWGDWVQTVEVKRERSKL